MISLCFLFVKKKKYLLDVGYLFVINGFYDLIDFVVLVVLKGKFLMREMLFSIFLLDWEDLFFEKFNELWSIWV